MTGQASNRPNRHATMPPTASAIPTVRLMVALNGSRYCGQVDVMQELIRRRPWGVSPRRRYRSLFLGDGTPRAPAALVERAAFRSDACTAEYLKHAHPEVASVRSIAPLSGRRFHHGVRCGGR